MERNMNYLGDIPSQRRRFSMPEPPQPSPQPGPPQPRPIDGPIPQAGPPRPRWMDGPIPSSQPRPRWIDGPRSFASQYGPQIQQLQQRFPGFAGQARSAWQQMRQQQGPGFWRNYINPNQTAGQNFPGFLNMYNQMMGGPPPQRFMNIAQNRGWAPSSQPRQRWIDR